MAERRGETLAPWLGLTVIAAWTLWDRYTFLTASDLATGIDGHYYAVQLRSLLDSGRLYYPDSPMALWLMAPLAWLLGPIHGLAMGAAMASAAIVVAGFVLVRRMSQSGGAALVAAAILASSAGAFYLPTEFVKNTFGLALGLAYLAALLGAIEQPRRLRIALAAGWFLLTALCHPLVTVLVALVSVAPMATALWTHGSRATPVAIAGAALAGTFAAAMVRKDILAAFAGPFDPSLVAMRVGDRALGFRGEPIFAALVGVALLVGLALRHRSALQSTASRSIAAGLAGWALIIAWPFWVIDDPQGPGFRLRILAFVPLALCAALVTAMVTNRLSDRTRVTVAMLVVGFALYRPSRYTEPVVRADPTVARALAGARDLVDPNHVVISPERHLAFMTMWHASIEARMRPDGADPLRTWRLLPISYMRASVLGVLDQLRARGRHTLYSLHPAHPSALVLMPEATWQAVLDQLPEPDRRYYQSWPTY